MTQDFGKDVLNKVNIVIVPRINPDGSYAFKRQLANNLDGNRDYIKLESPEVQSVRAEFNRFHQKSSSTLMNIRLTAADLKYR